MWTSNSFLAESIPAPLVLIPAPQFLELNLVFHTIITAAISKCVDSNYSLFIFFSEGDNVVPDYLFSTCILFIDKHRNPFWVLTDKDLWDRKD